MKNEAWQPGILWRVRLFEGPLVENAGGEMLCRFRSHKVGALLAYLALHLGRPCPREELYLALWPEEHEVAIAANRLRVTLASLRRQLEPPGVTFGTVLDVSVKGRVLLRSEAVWCDAIALERAIKAARYAQAAALAHGTLLPGYYEDWALAARRHLETLCENLSHADLSEVPSDTLAGASFAAHPSPSAAPDATQPAPSQPALPLYLTRFFGREAEQRQLLELLAAHRLVTLIGPGGMGKTRLAVETAGAMPERPVFVSLAELTDASRIAETILSALLISARPETDAEHYLVDVLQSRDAALLILDNAEHLLDAVADVGLRLLHAVPHLRLLITSRQQLNILGESTLTLLPLELPPPSSLSETLLEFPAAALFVDRARMCRPDFSLAPRHADALAEICRRVEGLPLALELAAARISIQTPMQIVQSLTAGLLDLKSRQRGLSARHRSLRAAIQGSYDLLSPPLQAFFVALSIFQDGWLGEAAQSVTGCAEAGEFLEELTQRSLMTAREDAQTGAIRYGFLETIRQFAAEQLPASERKILAQRHAAFYLELAAQVSEQDVRTLLLLDREQANLLAALETGRQAGTLLFSRGLTGALLHMFTRGHHRVALTWAETALAIVNGVPDPYTRTRLRYAACMILADVGRLEELHKVALEAWEDADANGDAVGAVYAETQLGYAANEKKEFEAAVDIQRAALLKARSLDDPMLLSRCLVSTTRALNGYGGTTQDDAAALAALRESEDLARECLAQMPPYSRLNALVQLALAISLMYQGRAEEAYTFLKLSQRTALAHGTLAILMYGFYYESFAAQEERYWGYVALLQGAFLNLQERMGYSAPLAMPDLERLHIQLRHHLGEAEFDRMVERGRRFPPETLVACSLSNPSSLPTGTGVQGLAG